MKHWLLFGVIYLVVYFILAITFIQVDNYQQPASTFLFLPPFLTSPLVVIAIYFSGHRRTLVRSIQFVILLSIHYLITFLIVKGYLSDESSWNVTYTLYKQNAGIFIFTCALYLLGQLAIWISYFLRPNFLNLLGSSKSKEHR